MKFRQPPFPISATAIISTCSSFFISSTHCYCHLDQREGDHGHGHNLPPPNKEGSGFFPPDHRRRHDGLPTSSINMHSPPYSSSSPASSLWVLEYDCRSKNPKWTYEYLERVPSSSNDRNSSRLKASFFPEPLLLEPFKIRPKDYNNSGLDR